MKNAPASSPSVKLLLCAAAASLLVACGGNSDDPGPTAGTASPAGEDARRRANAVFVPSNIPADANTRGMWSPVYNWPLIPLHLVMLPDGRLMSYGTDGTGRQTGKFIYDIWDPEGGLNGGHLTINKDTLADIFCSSQLVLPSTGEVFVAGGDNWTGTGTTNTGNNSSNVFTPAPYPLPPGSQVPGSLAAGNTLNRARWYSSSTTLLNGETYVQGGSGGTDRPEVRATDGTFRLLNGADTSPLNFMYPRNFIAPDGRVFGYDSNGRMYTIDASGNGTYTSMGQFNAAYTGSDASAAMFRPGRILQFGGNSNGAAVIDIRGPAPTFTPTQSMSTQRRLVNGTILADGKVLATGGSRVWNELTDVNNIAEIWNPDTGGWTQGASGNRARLYHSVAMLMPDATVLVGGGGAPGPQNNTNIELYYPPYLFNSGGVLAARPSITTAPTVLDIGKTFKLQVAGSTPVGRVVLIKTGSVTHSWNMEQRLVELTYTTNGNELSVQAPTRAGDAPPGFYMVFVLNTAGVPSVAKMVRMNVAATPNPAITPTLTNPGDQASTVGTPVNLQLNATDPNGDVLGFGATGLPPGISLNGITGAITGSPTAAGTFNVVVAASDGVNSASASFTWTISGAPALVVTVPVAPVAMQSGSAATFSASSNGINPQYKWNFGDGSAETAYSSSPTATHSYSAPGLYFVTLTAIDDRGVEQRVTVLQTIYLPLTAQKPSASSNIVVEPRGGANHRLWVVNQDNDSVSVFDAITRAKLAEITVGTAPRTIAVAPNGMLWVSNKQSATISVIDPGTLAINRTLTLPRASQPFGIAMSAGGGFALVALEATGQVLKLGTSSYAQLASAVVGGNPRHVSISADGATAYVSRFVTAPLAGEGTAAVNTASGGAEVLRIGTAAMNLLGTTVLAHSDKSDAENQGSGVPNYLGAAVISPDASQAWVPSKQDNIQRGTLRDGNGLNFQNTVRAISSRIDLATNQEDLAARIDHDNASMASAAAFDPNGIYLFVALETSREVAVVDAHGRREVMRFDAGRAPQGLAISADGNTLFVSNFMDRSVGVFDLRPLRDQGLASVPSLATLNAVATERLTATVLRGKQFFYDARDTRLARDRYMSCASCHNDGGHDGRVWDLTGFGEGLRNTISLRGRSGAQGFLHWSNNFDEVQDFEGQIRTLAGGTGLMSDAQFNTGTRSQPLGTAKAGVSADLDALAAYVGSLNTFDASPYRPSATTLSATAAEGKLLFTSLNCASCHGGSAFSNSGANTLSNVGTLKPSSGQRLGGALSGIDVPTLRDVWATAPYLHDGSAPTLADAVRAHNNVTVSDTDLPKIAAYLREIGSEEGAAPSPVVASGLTGNYFNNISLSGTPALTRTEAINFNWGSGSPGAGINTDNFSVRWTGTIAPTTSGSYRFRSYSDDGVRVWVNGVQVINNWTDHAPTNNTSGNVSLTAGQRYTVTVEYYERGGGAVMQLNWRLPGTTSYVIIPAARLAPN
jgi:YVTN family beta-propeller protein